MADSRKNVDVRLHALKAVDAVLAALQSTFAQADLIEGDNPFRFVAGDAKGSKVWICDPEGRDSFDRTSGRMLIMVYRGEFQPQDLHLANHADGAWDSKGYSDIGQTNVFIQCEAGNKTQSETIASIVFQILKMYRLEIQREFDIYDLKPYSVSAPSKQLGVTGEPWATTVSVRVQTQEMFRITERANTLNNLDIRRTYDQNVQREFATLDGSGS
jgi:hypothetical protein